MNASHIFLAVAGVGAVLVVIGLVRFISKHFSPGDAGGAVGGESSGLLSASAAATDPVPAGPLQLRAWWGLIVTLATSAAIAAVFWLRDASLSHEDRGTRLLTLAVVLIGVLVYGVVTRWTRLRTGRGEVVMDERDRMILGRAPAVQLYAVFIALGIWCITLTEVYWDSGSVPVFYMYLIFWTLYAVSIVAWSVGVLIGYRRL